VLAGLGGEPADLTGCLGKLERRAGRSERAVDGMVDLDEHLARLHLRVGDHLGHVVHGRGGDAAFRQRLHDRGLGPLAGPALDDAGDLVAAIATGRSRREAGIAHEVAAADVAYLARLTDLARRFGFVLFSDECYSEIYTEQPPASALEAAGPEFQNVVVFQSLSKRSNLPGLRVGFVAGDRNFLARFLELRNVASPQVPLPAQRVAIAAYGDEAHVEENRRLYALKFDLADQIIGNRYGYRRPAGGFLLWLDVSAHGGDEAVTLRLWREAGLRVIPGRYLARDQADGSNPGLGYIRVALVQDQEATAEALHRLVGVLG